MFASFMSSYMYKLFTLCMNQANRFYHSAASITYEKFLDWSYHPGLLVLHWEKRIGGAIGLWPISERAAARLTNGQMKESDLTGEMMRPPFREAPTRYWYVSGILRPELGGTRAIREESETRNQSEQG